MKKIILALSILALVSFSGDKSGYYAYTPVVNGKLVQMDGMRYLILDAFYSSSSAPFVINLTKDKLECQYYQQQIQKNKK